MKLNEAERIKKNEFYILKEQKRNIDESFESKILKIKKVRFKPNYKKVVNGIYQDPDYITYYDITVNHPKFGLSTFSSKDLDIIGQVFYKK